jgi:hypothetical protein
MVKLSGWRSDLALNSIDILTLTAFAVVQPLFGLLGRSAGFFLAHRSQPVDFLALVLFVYAIPAGIPILIEWLVALAKPKALAPLHRVVLALLLTIDALRVARRTGLPGVVSLLIAIGAGIFLAVLYMRIRTWWRSLIWVSPAVVVFPALLLFFSPASTFVLPSSGPPAAGSRVGNPVPIVMIVFDEFPLASLMDADGQIDRASYPNFAELAREGTWYRNATTAGESTLLALPAILSGRYPDPKHLRLPDADAFPNNLFTLLSSAYRMNVTENDTRLCPEQLCAEEPPPAIPRIANLLEDAAVLSLYTILPADFTGPLPDVTQSWGHFRKGSPEHPTVAMWMKFGELTDWHDRPRRFREFVASIRPSAWPTLNFLHVLLPHAPWTLLPSGQEYAPPEAKIRGLVGINDRGADPNHWTGDAWAAAQSYQRHLLQVEFVDRLVGSLVTRLRDTGLYDSTLLVITADHGTSFLPSDSRRGVTGTNHADLMAIPLFIKYPHQERAGIDDRNAENVDILPTALEVLKLKTTYRPEGVSLLGQPPAARRVKTVASDKVTFAFSPGMDALLASVRRKIEMFGGAGRYDVYRLGDRYGWIGKTVPAATPEERGIACQLDRGAYYWNVDLTAPTVLTDITGHLDRPQAGAPAELAVAVNGTIRTITESYRDGDQERFAALVPEDALRRGRNDIAVFLVRGASQLGLIPRAATKGYAWGTLLSFGRDGSALPYYGIGWSTPEEGITWSDGHLASLYLPAPPPRGDVTLTARLSAFAAPGKLDRQRIRVLANHHEVAQWTANQEFGDYTATIPKQDLDAAVLEIAFDLPEAACPVEIGAGADSRTLGVAVSSIKLDQQEGR